MKRTHRIHSGMVERAKRDFQGAMVLYRIWEQEGYVAGWIIRALGEAADRLEFLGVSEARWEEP